MSAERLSEEELTPEQQVMADQFIDACELEQVAGEQIVMYGQAGSVRYGLGRCAEYLMDKTPDEIRDMVLTHLKEHQTE